MVACAPHGVRAELALLGLRVFGVRSGGVAVTGVAVRHLGGTTLGVVLGVGLGVKHAGVLVGTNHGEVDALQDFVRLVQAHHDFLLLVLDQGEDLALDGQDAEAAEGGHVRVDDRQGGFVLQVGGQLCASAKENDVRGHLIFPFGGLKCKALALGWEVVKRDGRSQ